MSRVANSYLAGSALGGRQTMDAFQAAMATAHLVLSRDADRRAQEAHNLRMKEDADQIATRQASQDYLTRQAERGGMFNAALPDGTAGPPAIDETAANQFRQMDPILQQSRVEAHERMLENERARTGRERLLQVQSEIRQKERERQVAVIEKSRPQIGDQAADDAILKVYGTELPTRRQDPKAINQQEAAAKGLAAAEAAQAKAVEAAKIALQIEARYDDPKKGPRNPARKQALEQAYLAATQRLAEISAQRADADGIAAGTRVQDGAGQQVRTWLDSWQQPYRGPYAPIADSGQAAPGPTPAPTAGSADPQSIIQAILADPASNQLTDDQITELVLQQMGATR